MIIASVKFSSIKVAKYSKDHADIRIFFNDGEEKALDKSVVFGNSEETVDSVFHELKAMQKKLNKNIHGLDSDDLFGGAVMVRFMDEEKTRAKMKIFLDKVAEKAASIRAKRDVAGYLDMINQIQRMECSF